MTIVVRQQSTEGNAKDKVGQRVDRALTNTGHGKLKCRQVTVAHWSFQDHVVTLTVLCVLLF